MPIRTLTVDGRFIVGDDAAGIVVRVDLAEDRPGYVREGHPVTDEIVFPQIDEFTLSSAGVGRTGIYGSHDYVDGPRLYTATFTDPASGRTWPQHFFMPDSSWTLASPSLTPPPVPVPVPTVDLGWLAWSVDSVFTVPEVLAGGQEGATGGYAPIPDRVGTFQFLGIWLPGTRWAAVSSVTFSEQGQPENTFNQITTFESAVAFTVDSVAGELRVTTNARGRGTIGGTAYWS